MTEPAVRKRARKAKPSKAAYRPINVRFCREFQDDRLVMEMLTKLPQGGISQWVRDACKLKMVLDAGLLKIAAGDKVNVGDIQRDVARYVTATAPDSAPDSIQEPPANVAIADVDSLKKLFTFGA